MITNYLSSLKTNRKSQLITALTAIVLCAIAVFTVLQLNFVTIYEDGKEVASFTTFKEEQAELLEEAALTL